MLEKQTYDPLEYIRGLQQLLVSDKKKIAFLFGAGTSVAKKNENSITVPSLAGLTKEVEKELPTEYKKAVEEIKAEIGQEEYNIETLLSNIEQKRDVIGGGSLNGLIYSDFMELITRIKNLIRIKVGVHKNILNNDGINNLIHVDFADWISKADRKHSIEIFTTNYDYLFELGMEDRNIPYYDGFTGSYRPFFDPESVDNLGFLSKQTKLWKIHGSLGWHLDFSKQKVWRKDSDNEDILIYPSALKYADSKKQPYVALMDRLTNFLKQPDTVLITCGYSFNDEHINERILTALKSDSTAYVCGLYYDIVRCNNRKDYSLTKDSHVTRLAETCSKISILGCRNAIIGCKYGKWKLKREPDKQDTINVNLYFDEDGPTNANDLKKGNKKGEEIWTGEGELILPDFARFVMFLKSMIANNKTIGGEDE